MDLQVGARLGPYEVLSAIGAGGMGEVYSAHDTKLDRNVAIKVLTAAVFADAERNARFEREAKTLAALNHPNIAHIYSVEESNGVLALVMELVAGPTLADRIAQGPIPLDEALPIAKQIAEALEAAHEHGIIHRDLKPANIKVREDGVVKVLDFGLAKLVDSAPVATAPGNITSSPTITSPAMMTGVGVILGTAAYMSPEQASGKSVDKRTDLWAFGVVLMEMLTGCRLFDGETTSHVIASVLKDAPDWSALPPDTPPAVRKLLRRCLEKDRRRRLADAADARLDVEDALTSSEQPSTLAAPTPLAHTSGAGRWIVPLATFAVGIALTAVITIMVPRTHTASTAPVLAYKPLSFEPGGNLASTWSPNGKGVAFAAAQHVDEPTQIYVRYLDSSLSTPLTHVEGGASPIAWTSTGRIVFRSLRDQSRLWSISQTGGEPEPFFTVTGVQTAVGIATVRADGRVIAYYARQNGKYDIWTGSPGTSSPPILYTPAPFEAERSFNVANIQFSPDGTRLLLFRNSGNDEEAWLMPYPADARHPPRRIFEQTLATALGTPTASWMPDSQRVVFAMASSAPRISRLYLGDTASGAVSLLSGGTRDETFPSVSPDGRVAFTEAVGDYNVVQVDVRTGEVTPILSTARREDMPAWAMRSPALAYVTDRTGPLEIWLHQPDRPDRPIVTARDLVDAGHVDALLAPALSPDGTRIIYETTYRSGARPMWLASLNGGAPVRVTNAGGQLVERPGAWSPDGAWFVYWDSKASGTSLNRVRTTGEATPEVLVQEVAHAPATIGLGLPTWSPLGNWILHKHDGTWRLLSPDGKTERDLGIDATTCGFSHDGSEVYCVRAEGISVGPQLNAAAVLFSRAIAGGDEHVIARLGPGQVPRTNGGPALRMTLSPDGQHVTFSVIRQETNLWLLEGLQGESRR